MVSQERERWEYVLLPIDRGKDISVRRKDQQITGKKERKYVSSNNPPWTEKYVGEEGIHLSA